MPTVAFKVQQDGFWRGWDLLVGGDFGYETVLADDADVSYLRLPRLAGGGGRISFPIMLQASGMLPLSIALGVTARRTAAIHPRLQAGFYRGGNVAFHADLFDPTEDYELASWTFTTDPLTGAAWTEAGLIGLEVCVQSESGVLGSNRITAIVGTITFSPQTNWTYPEPVMSTY